MKRGAIIGLLFISVFLLSGIAGCGSTSSSGSPSSPSGISNDDTQITSSSPSASNDDATNTQPTQTAQPGQGAISIESLSTTITKIHEWPETRRGEEWAEVKIDISGSAAASALRHPGEYRGHVSVVWLLYPQDYHIVTDSPFGKQYIDAGEGYFGAFIPQEIQSPWGYEYDRNSEEPLTIKWTGQTNRGFDKGQQIMIIAQLNWPGDFEDFFQATYEVITPFP